MKELVKTQYPVHDLIQQRWSPRAFKSTPIEHDTLMTLFEAARLAPSSYNEQPWRFIVAQKAENPRFYSEVSSWLAESNRVWATKAPVLVVVLAKTDSSFNGSPNRHAWHDVGIAVGNLSLQATAIGLSLHQMGGFSAAKAKEVLQLPDNYEAVSVIALGYRDEASTLPEPLQQREQSPQKRKPLEEIVFIDSAISF